MRFGVVFGGVEGERAYRARRPRVFRFVSYIPKPSLPHIFKVLEPLNAYKEEEEEEIKEKLCT
jgi:hypothetical protein